MNCRSVKSQLSVLCFAIGFTLLGGVAYAAKPGAPQIKADQKSKVSGTIVSRNGDLVKVNDKKSGQVVVVSMSDSTKIERKKGGVEFFRHKDMDVTAMLPGLTIDAEGVGNAKGQLVASKVTFNPDEFAVEVAEEQQIMANKAAAKTAQTTANQGVAAAGAAQSSANAAQSSANKAQGSADIAGAAALMDAEAIGMVNKRVSDLDEYKMVAEAGIYFPSDKSALDDAAKADLDKLAAFALPLEGYMIEVAGYTSSTGTKQQNQQLSEARAAAVVQYLREKQNVPMRRILVPAGYGASHPAAANTDSMGRALNRRVDVKVLVNKGLEKAM